MKQRSCMATSDLALGYQFRGSNNRIDIQHHESRYSVSQRSSPLPSSSHTTMKLCDRKRREFHALSTLNMTRFIFATQLSMLLEDFVSSTATVVLNFTLSFH